MLASDIDIFVGECKWKNQKVGKNVLLLLQKRAELICNNRNVEYAIFSKSGFTDELKNIPSAKLITAEEIANIK